ncbi:MAG: OadG family protein [Clostridia bacterium]|nr:OadG family protein [Clostridia bacterium]
MLNQLLTSALPEGGQWVTLGEASLFALIGFLVVFAGISFLILVVWLVGKVMSTVNDKMEAKKKVIPSQQEPQQVVPSVESDEVDEETVAVIMAALMEYYQTNNPKCGFTLKRIKRIRRDDYA